MKTTFTKTLAGILMFTLIALSSCSKEKDSPSGYYVKFKLNGTEKQYSETTAAIFTTYLPLYACAMVGQKTVGGTVYEGMGINLFNDAPIEANVTYTEEEVEGTGATQAALLYTDDKGAQFSSAFLGLPDVKVTITNMDDKTVTGTFSGNLVSTQDFTTTQIVTEGTFHLPRN